jgi:hypothetical protein
LGAGADAGHPLLIALLGKATMIGVKEAVTAARAFAEDLLGADTVSNVTLEEVELSSGDRYWLVTLGLPARLGALESIAKLRDGREYKVFKVSVDDGSVVSMKIHQVA